jgi:hypothetical protein
MDLGKLFFAKFENTIEKQQLSPAAEPTLEWSAGSSSKPFSILLKIPASLSTQGHKQESSGDCS